ncbi:MAG: protein translocase subunit SecD [bacterium]|nr:protein translocase subunit SecD [bacterium]
MSKKHLIISIVLLVVFAVLGYFVVQSNGFKGKFPYSFGLDLVGGTELIYRADTSKVEDEGEAMEALKEVIERRVNIFGVSEPLVQTEQAGLVSGSRENRLIVGLPGVADIDEAIRLIGQTPVLEFMLVDPAAAESVEENPDVPISQFLVSTGLTGRYLSRAQVVFDPNTGAAYVSLEFNSEGAGLFAEITRENKGEVLAIILDGSILSVPVIQDEIRDGKAQITGQFSPEEARELVRNLNYGALPVPIELAASQSVGATLGAEALEAGVRAGVIGFILLSIFMVLWYRLPGVVSVAALVSYVIVSLAIFKLIPVTLSAAGIAGFILSVGMAVDANVLIFERAKEELKKGKSIRDSLHEGFKRAWLSIRDSNISSIITAVILFWLGTSAVKGFALTLGIGVLVSMLTAISVSRTFLFAIAPKEDTSTKRFLFSSGIKK